MLPVPSLSLCSDVDRFRLSFFEKVIQEEETKERQRALRQRMCHHRYEPTGVIPSTGLFLLQCRRCEHVIHRSLTRSPVR